MARQDRFITLDGTELHYSEWGPPDAPPVICVHGISRVGRDFDPLASALEDDYRVLCPDMPGRGLSEWANHPAEEYAGSAMTARLVAFCHELELEPVRWIGTSMGGSLGITLAAGALTDRLSHLVVNDVGPDSAGSTTEDGVDRIIEYLSNPPRFDRLTDLQEYYHDVYEPFSAMTDAEWRRFTLTSARRTDTGQLTPNYDPRVVEPLLAGEQPTQWDSWNAIDAEIMILRGTDSDILSQPTFEEMQARQPAAETLEIDCGHAPALNVPEQIDPIRAFLD